MNPAFINNLTEATLLDGTYVFDVPPPGYIRATGTNVVAIVGEFEQGPTNQVLSIGSNPEFKRILGGFGQRPDGHVGTWRGYNGYRAVAGKIWPRLRIVRVGGSSAAPAQATIPVADIDDTDAVVLTVNTPWPGRKGNRLKVTIQDATDLSISGGYRLTLQLDDQVAVIDNINPAWDNDTLANHAASQSIATLLHDVDTAQKGEWPLTLNATGGADPQPALTDWTDALDLLLARRDVNILIAAEPNSPVTLDAINAHIYAAVASSTGTTPPIIPVLAHESDTDAADIATAAASYRSDRVVLAWPWVHQLFPQAVTPTNTLLVPSNAVVASALANTDPVLDPASPISTRFIASAVNSLEFDDLQRNDYITANQHGVLALEFDPDLGHKVKNGVTTSLRPGEEQVHRRRLADFFMISIATSLKQYQNLPITPPWKDDVVGAVKDFLERQTRVLPYPRVIAYDVDIDTVNDPGTEAQGQFYILTSIQTPASARAIVLLSQVGSTVQVNQVGQAQGNNPTEATPLAP